MTSEHDAVELTEDEERQFAELFSTRDRMTLTVGWQDILRTAVVDARAAGEAGVLDPPPPSNIALADETEPKNNFGTVLNVTIFGCIAVPLLVPLLIGIALWLAPGSVFDDDEFFEDTNPVLPSEAEISLPPVDGVELPTGTVDLVDTDDHIIAIVQSDTGSLLYRSTNGREWNEFADLALVDPSISVVDGSFVVAGGSIDSLVERTGVPGIEDPTDIRVMQSIDDGASWTMSTVSIEVSDSESVSYLENLIVAQANDSIVLGYETRELLDLTSLARAEGLVGSRDRVVQIAPDGFRPVPYAIGPEVVGEIDLGFPIPIDSYNFEILISTNGDNFEPLERYDGYDIDRSSGLIIDDDSFVVDGQFDPGELGFAEPDGSEESVPFAVVDGRFVREDTLFEEPAAIRDDDWEIPIDPISNTVWLDGRFEPVPAPDTDMTGFGVETDFGVAIIWQPNGRRFDPNMVAEVNGYTIERASGTGQLTVLGPNGEVIVENQGHATVPKDPRVVSDTTGAVQIFDASRQRVAVVTDTDFTPSDQFSSEREPFIAWTANGLDWQYAPFGSTSGGFPSGNWFAADSGDGILVVDLRDEDSAAVISWPGR